ncbi:MAG: dihydropteroate synthase, partial [Chitinivibrionales bacterium]|nr:dihydropteroate synthase [Chitinivibrionales bacterium]
MKRLADAGRRKSLFVLDKPFVVMGVLNVTPDSFYDGGRFDSLSAAADYARVLINEGADVLDIGGESTRPGAEPVHTDRELSRVLPLVRAVRAFSPIPISVDTTKSVVAEQALDAGADWINDISAGRFDDAMAPLAARRDCPVVLMHSRERPDTMQHAPHYDDVIAEVCEELTASVEKFRNAGVAATNIILDPGIGFAKRFVDNIVILRKLDSLLKMGYPLLIGTSRKSFIGWITGAKTDERLWGTLGS